MTRKRSAVSRARRREGAKKRVAAAAGKVRHSPATSDLATAAAAAGVEEAVAEPARVRTRAAEPAAEAETPSDAGGALHPALDYLQQWRHARESWKFHKNHQTYLLKHALDAAKVPATFFKILSDYLQPLSGLARQRIEQDLEAAVSALRTLTEQGPPTIATAVSAEDADPEVAAANLAADVAAYEQKLEAAAARAKRAERLRRHLTKAAAA